MIFSEPSIKSLFLEMRFNGQTLASGTGFLVHNERHVFLVTNRHNVTGRNNETGEVISKTCGTPNEIVISHMVDVNYPDRSATTILAGGSGE